MVFEIKNKVALITGGASGIGMSLAKEILFNEAKGVTIADTNWECGVKAQQELQKAFGPSKCLFVKTDITDYNQFEETESSNEFLLQVKDVENVLCVGTDASKDELSGAFQKTIEKFGNIDILFNNAGIACDKFWEQEISTNMKGTVHGMLLGFERYLPQHKQDKEAVIVNTSSICGLGGFDSLPVYSATKSGIISLVKAWGNPDLYEENNVRVVGICPGATITPLFEDDSERYLGEKYKRLGDKALEDMINQESDFVAKETMKIIKYATSGSVWIIEDGLPGYQYIFPDRKTMRNNIIRCQ